MNTNKIKSQLDVLDELCDYAVRLFERLHIEGARIDYYYDRCIGKLHNSHVLRIRCRGTKYIYPVQSNSKTYIKRIIKDVALDISLDNDGI